MIDLTCSGCQSRLSVPPVLSGRKVRCPACKGTTTVPPPAPAESEQVTLPPGGAEQATLPARDDPEATLAPAPGRASRAADDRAPAGYEVLAELGRGGMGVVYRARQRALNREVALKMILAGAHAGADDQARFRTEAEAIARLQHPGIVQVFEVGEHDGRPYFSLELCPGGSLEKVLAGTPMRPKEAAALVRQLARAMTAAHQAGIIHRDLKPANVLLGADGQPKVTDFGLAKKLGEEGQTGTGSVMGTPSYMAPEQAEARKDVGPQADVYALGAILYECLTGRPPFKAATPLDTILQVVSEEPVPVTRLNAKVPRDLETICHKCLRKEPARRYRGATALADDLQRWLDGEPIAARPARALERAAKWVRRKPALAALVLVCVAAAGLLVAGGGVFTWQLARALDRARKAERDANDRAEAESQAKEEARQAANKEAEARRQAERETLRAEHARHAGQIDLAIRAWEQHDVNQAEHILDQVKGDFANLWETRYARGLIRKKLTRTAGISAYTAVAYRLDGKQFATADEGWVVRLWDPASARATLLLQGHKGAPRAIAYSRDGHLLASAAWDKTVRVWDTATGREKVKFTHTSLPYSVAINHDGTRIAVGDADGASFTWAPGDGSTLRMKTKHKGGVTAVAFSHDGSLVASADLGGELKVCDVTDGSEKFVLRGHDANAARWWDSRRVNAIAFSPDGKHLAAVGDDEKVRLWDAGTFKLLRTFHDHSQKINCVVFDRTGALLVTGGEDQSCRVRVVATGETVAILRGYRNAITGVAISPDGKQIVTGTKGNILDIWALGVGQEQAVLRDHGAVTSAVAFAPDGKTFASGDYDSSLLIRDAATGRTVRSLKGHKGQVLALAYSADGNYLVSAGGSALNVWEIKGGALVRTLAASRGLVTCAAISRDGSFVVAGSDDKTARVWDVKSGKVRHELAGHQNWVRAVALAPDDRTIVSGGMNGGIRVWDAATGKQLHRVELDQSQHINGVAFCRDGKRLATASGDTVKVWDTGTWQEVRLLRGHTATVLRVALLGEDRVVSCGQDHTVKLWDIRTGEEKLSLRGHSHPVLAVAVDREGRRIVSCGADRTVRIWEAPEARR